LFLFYFLFCGITGVTPYSTSTAAMRTDASAAAAEATPRAPLLTISVGLTVVTSPTTLGASVTPGTAAA